MYIQFHRYNKIKNINEIKWDHYLPPQLIYQLGCWKSICEFLGWLLTSASYSAFLLMPQGVASLSYMREIWDEDLAPTFWSSPIPAIISEKWKFMMLSAFVYLTLSSSQNLDQKKIIKVTYILTYFYFLCFIIRVKFSIFWPAQSFVV